jgi:sulfite dehydrogenase (quinone) subunit SoeC
MNPAFSVIFFTTLIGAAQGLFLALVAIHGLVALNLIGSVPTQFFVVGSAIALGLSAVGLVASFLHLGRPERAWRTVVMWRTSWLSREVIVLPAFMLAIFLYMLGHYGEWSSTGLIGVIGAVLAIALFICTAMIYACLRFLQEWASPLTLINYTVLGCASGFTLGAGFAAYAHPAIAHGLAIAALIATVTGLATRCASLVRNRRLKPKSTLRSAIGVKHPVIKQKAQGFMGSSFNTREFFHGRSPAMLRLIKWGFLAGGFAIPIGLLAIGLAWASPFALAAAFVVQYVGFIAERWFFFAQANHPQNLYYQAIS